MRIALIADLHGNRPATDALERDLTLKRPDKIYCLGDIVGKGPSSDYTFDWAMAHCDLVLGGNWDVFVGYKSFEPDHFYWEQLGEQRLNTLRELPLEKTITLSGRRIRLFHGRPTMAHLIHAQNPKEDILPLFTNADGEDCDVAGYADAHRQSLRSLDDKIFFNCGSVGNALGRPNCCYALLDGEETPDNAPFTIQMIQIPYDREQAVRDAQATPQVSRIDSFINEVKTGKYSR
ncbi:MAG TPA: metallophosphoesterase family protein [Candidatus Limiplasma sp.]|nr:metallophosphoesterase family protein [Candidatus Limiplasma sp.]